MLHPGRSRKQDPGGNGDNLFVIAVYTLTLHDGKLWKKNTKLCMKEPIQ